MLLANQDILAAKDCIEERSIYFSEGKDSCGSCMGWRERGIFPSGALQQELTLHFSHAATGGQPEGGSRPHRSPKTGTKGGRWKHKERRLRISSEVQLRGEQAAGELL